MVNGIEKAKNQVENLSNRLELLYYKEVKRILKSEDLANFYITKVLRMFNGMQSEYFDGGAEDDPTRFMEWTPLIEEEVRKELQKSAETVTKDGQLTLTVLSDEFLGIGESVSTDDPAPIKWAAYFIQGSPESDLIYTKSLIWYNKELASKSKKPMSNLGRFGSGYLIKTDSKFGKALVKKYGEDAIRHPQSGKPAKDWFEIYSVINPDDIYRLVQVPARDYALKNVKWKASK
jgi:hypothetical protein